MACGSGRGLNRLFLIPNNNKIHSSTINSSNSITNEVGVNKSDLSSFIIPKKSKIFSPINVKNEIKTEIKTEIKNEIIILDEPNNLDTDDIIDLDFTPPSSKTECKSEFLKPNIPKEEENYWSNRMRKFESQLPDSRICNYLIENLEPSDIIKNKKRKCSTSDSEDNKFFKSTKPLVKSASNSSVNTNSQIINLPTDNNSISPTPIFKGLIIYFDGLIDGDLSVHSLTQLLRYYGGKITYGPNSHTTHIICKNLSFSKEKKASTTNSKVKYVSSNWLIDSIHSNKRLNEEAYILFTPKNSQIISGFFNK